MPLLHDVATTAIINPPPGITLTGDYDVIGHIRNFGSSSETFDVTATVYDTTNGWAEVFSQTTAFTNFPAGYDSVYNFGIVTFNDSTVYNTQIYTQLGGNQNSNNDTASIYSKALPKIWYFGPSMTYARAGLDVVDYQGKIYAIGGRDSTATSINSVEISDIDIIGIEEEQSARHNGVALFEIYPNPFSKLTNISFDIGHSAKNIELKIYDVSGRVVKHFAISNPSVPSSGSRDLQFPISAVVWDGRDNFGKLLPSGIYYCRLSQGSYTETRKILFIK